MRAGVPLLLLLSVAGGTSSSRPLPLNWWYADVLNRGPADWGARYRRCAGEAQSPIDVQAGVLASPDTALQALTLNYGDVKVTEAVNTQTGLCVRLEGGAEVLDNNAHEQDAAGAPVEGGRRYRVTEIRVHTPAEHTFRGSRADMELQVVHEAVSPSSGDAQQHLVMAWFYHAGGAPNTALERLWPQAWPSVPDGEFTFYAASAQAGVTLPSGARVPTTAAGGHVVRLGELLPPRRDYVTYAGSFTAPPCDETVRYYLFPQIASMATSQLHAIRSALGLSAELAHLESQFSYTPPPLALHGNARPAQPLAGRGVAAFRDRDSFVTPEAPESNYSLSLLGCVLSSVTFVALTMKLLFVPEGGRGIP
eukprot:TRINITY_DN15165_c0_g1_i1.p1 TRINITY_DN15165_c0_g1~~TRINITY_DN15165_c0_g1_i1.p1  ORF type:complete len:365 (+),score=79.78 TRINITY_DN15165_c0_g1_i1:128-1222(+)